MAMKIRSPLSHVVGWLCCSLGLHRWRFVAGNVQPNGDVIGWLWDCERCDKLRTV